MISKKKNVGRPKLEEHQKKNKYFQLRLTVSEKETLIRLKKEGAYNNISDMIIDIVINKKYNVRTLDPELREEKSLLITQVKYIGNNFNQFLKLVQSKKLTYFTTNEKTEVLNNIKNINAILFKILKSL